MLPPAWIDRIFDKLAVTYGREFLSQYEGIEANSVRANWAYELRNFESRPWAIRYALEHLTPARPPNPLVFLELCRQAPAPPAPRLEQPKADPDVIRRSSEKLRALRTEIASGMENNDPLGWARTIVAKKKKGEHVGMFALNAAKSALAGRSSRPGPAG